MIISILKLKYLIGYCIDQKLLAFLILSFLLSKNVFALTVSCKNFYKGEVITNETFDLSTGSKWKAKFTDTHIYWRQFKITNDSEKKE